MTNLGLTFSNKSISNQAFIIWTVTSVHSNRQITAIKG